MPTLSPNGRITLRLVEGGQRVGGDNMWQMVVTGGVLPDGGGVDSVHPDGFEMEVIGSGTAAGIRYLDVTIQAPWKICVTYAYAAVTFYRDTGTKVDGQPVYDAYYNNDGGSISYELCNYCKGNAIDIPTAYSSQTPAQAGLTGGVTWKISYGSFVATNLSPNGYSLSPIGDTANSCHIVIPAAPDVFSTMELLILVGNEVYRQYFGVQDCTNPSPPPYPGHPPDSGPGFTTCGKSPSC